ncbi:hypothetical protein K3495_g13875 [Podosphaera aphanis]|nr:hypothetical protein K3495_g13875 [Podosphaera aphanis]
MIAVENLEGSSPDGSNEAPKEWARLEIELSPELRDDWPAFAQKLRDRYANPTVKHMRIQQRQQLKQNVRTVQEYKQRFEYLCKETSFPRQVWGEEFFKGLIEPLQVKLLGTPFIDITNYDVVTQLALQYETGFLMQKELKSLSSSSGINFRPAKKPIPNSSIPKSSAFNHLEHLSQDGKLSQEIKDYRKKHNLCMFDGGNHQTHECKRLIEKLAKMGRPPPEPPVTNTSKVYRPMPSPVTPLTIASLSKVNSVELLGEIGGIRARVLVDGAAQINACTSKLMNANPKRNIIHLDKNICSFDGKVAIPADLAYESTLTTKLPNLFDGNVNFVEAPIISYDAILGLPWLESVNPDIDWTTKKVTQRQLHPTPNLSHTTSENTRPYSQSSSSIPTRTTSNLSPEYLLLSELNQPNETFVNALSQSDAQQEDDTVVIPNNLKFLSEAFSKSSAANLPPYRDGFDMTIDIPDGKLPRVIPMSRLSEREKEEAKKQTNELIEKGWIRRCKAQAPANVLFVRKPHSQELRMCMDYRRLNSITTKDRYPVPNINDLLDKLRGAKYFTRLDIISAYNMIRIAPGHEWKTAFRTPDGCFEWLVMPFGLANSPPTWQSFIDHIFRDVNEGIVSYVDDFLIYAQSKQELHQRIVNTLKRLIQNNLYCKLSKCAFELDEVDFLGFVISKGGLKISPTRISCWDYIISIC